MANILQSLWQSQEPELNQMSLDDIRELARQALIHDRRYRFAGWLSAGLLAGAFSIIFLGNHTATGRAGAAIGIFTAGSMAYRAHRLTRTHPLMDSALGIHAYRRILQREARALTICWQTMMLAQLAVVVELLSHPKSGLMTAIVSITTVAPVLAVAWFTRTKANAYRRRVRDLDCL